MHESSRPCGRRRSPVVHRLYGSHCSSSLPHSSSPSSRVQTKAPSTETLLSWGSVASMNVTVTIKSFSFLFKCCSESVKVNHIEHYTRWLFSSQINGMLHYYRCSWGGSVWLARSQNVFERPLREKCSSQRLLTASFHKLQITKGGFARFSFSSKMFRFCFTINYWSE